MPESTKDKCMKILELVEELESVSNYKKQLDEEIKKIFDDYQAKKFGFFKYESLTKKILQGKAQKEWDIYYSHQIFHLLKRIEYANSEIFYESYEMTEPRLERIRPEEAAEKKKKPLLSFMFRKRKKAEEKAPEIRGIPKAEEIEAPVPERIEAGLERLAEKPEIEKIMAAIEEMPKPLPKMPEIPIPPRKERIEEKPAFREIIRERPRERIEELIPEERIEYAPIMREEMPLPEEIKEKARKIIREKRFVQPSLEEKPGKEREEIEIPAISARKPEKYEEEWKKPEIETKLVAEERKEPFWKRLMPAKKMPEAALPRREFKKELKATRGAKAKRPAGEMPHEKVMFTTRITDLFGIRKKKTTFDMILEEERKIKKEEGAVKLRSPIASMMGNLVKRLMMKETPDSKKKRLIEKDMRLRFMRTGALAEKEGIEHISGSLLKKEAKRIQQIMQKQKQLKLYKPTMLGTIANLSVREISYSLIDMFPDSFRQLYNNLRLANIKILSNTYVNMMVFSTIATTLAALVILPTVFFLQGSPLLTALLQALIMSIVAGAITFLGFYSYPILKIKERRRSIKTNLPFALNHMAAVASSGVPPNVLFRLIASSKEYGEICIESEKINQFVTIFGYDLLSAIKTVAETTPSIDFKDFLDGMVSTIESGGNLEQFLHDKSKEELLSYELERQKYTETIATYSDIYTGLLIAAPLFFVAALSLISILGGEIGGVPVEVIITVGTYIVLPMLNIIFLVFLEITQPEF